MTVAGTAQPTSVSSWFSSTIKNLLIPVPIVLVAPPRGACRTRLLAEQELITAGTVLTVVFGALAPVVPYVLCKHSGVGRAERAIIHHGARESW